LGLVGWEETLRSVDAIFGYFWGGGFSVDVDVDVDVDGFVLLGLTATAAGRTCGAGKWADSFFFVFL
jgi:hypothetical protein